MTFWQKFYTMCQKKGETPSAVALKIGVSRASVSAWKNSNSMPSVSTRLKLCEHFDLAPDYNWEDDDKNYFQRIKEEYEKNLKIAEDATKAKSKRIIPVYGRVAAGIPIEEITDIEDYEEISDAMAANGEYFALKIHGDSMEPRMCEGDVIIVRKQENVESGETAVVSVNGFEATCKKVCFTDDGVELVSMNAKYKPMVFTKEQAAGLPIKILGKVVEIRCKSW